MANLSILRPRQRAARKCPSSWTKMSRLNRTSTSSKININFRTYIYSYVGRYPKSDNVREYSGPTGAGNGVVDRQKRWGVSGEYHRHRRAAFTPLYHSNSTGAGKDLC